VNALMNDELRHQVCEGPDWDPNVDGGDVAVLVEDGVVTLQGSIGGFRRMREATKAAERVRGVIDVDDQLDVMLRTEQSREDAEVRGDVLQAPLLLDAQPPASVDVRVRNGFVTLTGAGDRAYQRNEAVFIAGNVPGAAVVVACAAPGVRTVNDRITVTT
jgi:osmotically-inducible protein OsmY